jgi:hypothetical protein
MIFFQSCHSTRALSLGSHGAGTRTIPHPNLCPICMQIGWQSDSASDSPPTRIDAYLFWTRIYDQIIIFFTFLETHLIVSSV